MSDEQKKEPVVQELPEGLRILMEARELRVQLAKQKVVSRIEHIVEMQKAELLRNALTADPELRAAEALLRADTNKVLDELEPLLPEGYAITDISWEKASYTGVYQPAQRGKRHE